ncbi:MAG: MFS transporter [Alphaproteobacteria bacterium]|nr:MFS transporter [Alphaproteobacteria bacterium]
MRLVIVVCLAQVLVQLGAFFWPALLPGMMPLWNLDNGAAGWITASFYGAYMLAVPVLVTLTDRVPAKRVYLFGVACTVLGHGLFAWLAEGFWSALALRALTGVGWAGTYMTGLKLLADQVDSRAMSRAVTGHAAGIGISGALSFVAADLIADQAGWAAAFAVAAACAAVAWVMVAVAAPTRPSPGAAVGGRLFDFRPVFANRSAMAYASAYCVHTLEMSALRGWAVVFLGWAAVTSGGEAWLAPALVATILGLVGTAASVMGNELAIRLGRARFISLVMLITAAMAVGIAPLGATSYGIAVAVLTLYSALVWLDSSSLTAGAAGTADPARRGATLAVHSMLGYAGGFVGPIVVGEILDAMGGRTVPGWTAAFGAVAALGLAALLIFRRLRPRDLDGDRGR